MNIRDTIGEESFYQAQVNQLNVLINTINDNTHNSNSYLCIMDEVLNSTNYHAATSIIGGCQKSHRCCSFYDFLF